MLSTGRQGHSRVIQDNAEGKTMQKEMDAKDPSRDGVDKFESGFSCL